MDFTKNCKWSSFALVLVLSISCLPPLCSGSEEAAEPGIVVAAACPDDVVFLASLDQPGKMLSQFLPFLQLAQMAVGDEMANALNAAKAFVAAHSDINLLEPASYAKAGIDIAKPVTFALMSSKGAEKRLRLVVGVGVSDAAKAEKTVEQLFQGGGYESAVDREKALNVYHFQGPSRRLNMAVKSSRMYLCIAEGLDQMPLRLGDFLLRPPTSTLKETAVFKNTIAALKPRPGISVYFNLKGLASEPDATEDWMLRNFQVFSINSTFDNQLSFLLTFQDTAPLKRLLAPGGTCKPFLSRFDKPLAALTLSLKNPLDLVKHLVQESDGPDAWDFVMNNLKHEAGIDLSALKLLTGGETLGIVAYPSRQERPNFPFDVTVFSKVMDGDGMTAALGKVNMLRKAGSIQDSPLFMSPPMPVPLGISLVDDYFVGSTEVSHIRQVAEGKKASSPWAPYCGKRQLLSGEIYARDIAVKYAQKIPQAGMIGFWLPEGPFLLDLSRLDQGIKLSIAGDKEASMLFALQASVLAGFLVPSVVEGRASGRQVQCKSRQSQLSMMMLLYSDDHGGKFPAKLSDLYHAMPEARNLELYTCPERGTVLRGPEEIDTKSDFHYVKGLRTGLRHRSILLYDKKPHADGRVCVARVDASVKWMTPAELKAALEKQKEQ